MTIPRVGSVPGGGVEAPAAVDLPAVYAARDRIRDAVRRTPMVRAAPVRDHAAAAAGLWLKLECLQIAGSFKARGATSKLRTLSADTVRRGLITASGGNHGLGVAYAGWLAGAPTTVYLPRSAPPAKAASLERWGTRVVVEGEVWDDASAAALAQAARDGMTYVHPFADPAVIAGQGTIALEVLEDAPGLDTLVVAIGGGGLIAGVATAARALRPSLRVIGVEPTGAPTLRESLRMGRLIELDRIATAAGTLAPRRSAAINLDLVQQHVEEIVLVEDGEMREAARWLWREMAIATELAGAAAVAAVLTGKVSARDSGPVCALVCGAGTDGLDMTASF